MGVDNGPQTYDAFDYEKIRGPANPDQTQRWGLKAAEFINSPPGWGGPGWVGKRPLGQGGFGTAGLWVKYNEDGNVIDVLFLGFEKPMLRYPTMKLADFGLAVRTSMVDLRNPTEYTGSGTHGYMADEQNDDLRYMIEIPNELKKSEGKLAAWTNVWGIGAVMYELMTLIPVRRIYMKGNGVLPINTTRVPDYSPELRNLIRECLNASPEKRVDLAKLNQITKRFLNKTKRAGIGQKEKLYYRGAEINQMPLGDREPMAYEKKYKPSAILQTQFPVSSEAQLRIPHPNGSYEEYTDNIEEESDSDPDNDGDTLKPDNKTLKANPGHTDTITDTEMDDYIAFYGPQHYTNDEQKFNSLFDTQIALGNDDRGMDTDANQAEQAEQARLQRWFSDNNLPQPTRESTVVPPLPWENRKPERGSERWEGYDGKPI
ncbi:MAG: hypothetical protein M1812_003506 [Candelaria pacifica]|nr:MAG: hypothetical protein M1812_003506 [Candelaria pacifica]